MNKHLVGVMQGRLLPKYQGRYQVDYWADEFHIAKDIGLDSIEFILDYNDAEKNPLLRSGGIDEILSIVKQTGVTTNTICADYFMEAPLHSDNENVAQSSLDIMKRLLVAAEKLAITDIVIPCVDQSSLTDDSAVERFVKVITFLLKDTESKKINFSLETDLPPDAFVNLLDRFDSERITVNYDIGNSAALGFDPIEELNAYGNKITDIHIKDRVLNGGPIVLGEGNANFALFFDILCDFKIEPGDRVHVLGC